MIDPSNKIHSTAIVSEQVSLGKNNIIGAYCILDGEINIGDNNVFKPHVVCANKVSIGNQNEISSFTMIGEQAEMKNLDKTKRGAVTIGNRNTIKEHVSIHGSYYNNATIIKDNCFIMNKSYLAHDVELSSEVVLSCGVKLAGRVVVGAYANIGMGATVHQRIPVGSYTMVGMQAAVTKAVLPFSVVSGVPATIKRFNSKGAQFASGDKAKLKVFDESFLNMIQKGDFGNDEIAQIIKDFISKYDGDICKIA